MTQATKLYAVQAAGKGGYVDRSGALKIPLTFDGAGQFSEGIAPVQLHGRAGLIDERGELIALPSWRRRAPAWILPFSEGMAVARFEDQKVPQFGAVDRTGAMVVPPEYEGLSDFVDGIAAARIAVKEHVFLDRKGAR